MSIFLSLHRSSTRNNDATGLLMTRRPDRRDTCTPERRGEGTVRRCASKADIDRSTSVSHASCSPCTRFPTELAEGR